MLPFKKNLREKNTILGEKGIIGIVRASAKSLIRRRRTSGCDHTCCGRDLSRGPRRRGRDRRRRHQGPISQKLSYKLS